MKEILKLESVSLAYHTPHGEIVALKNLCMSVNNGEFVAIIGPSGCGKTSILSMIAGLIKPSGGKVVYKGETVGKPNGNIGYMLQRDELFEWRTIETNAYLPLEIKGINTAENRERVNSLLKKYDLWDFRRSNPSRLSGGMRQRAALIRTLSTSPELLLLDEPFSALDYQTRLNVCDDVYSIIKGEKKTAVLVTHDISEAIAMADRIYVLTKRPSSVLAEHVVDLDKSLPPIRRRECERFGKYFELIRKELE